MRKSLPVLLALLAGCGGPEPVKLYPVAGRLLVNGLPAANAMVAFHPADGGATCPVGLTGKDGTFRLTTRKPGDGAPAGEYAVTVVWPDSTVPVDECLAPTAHDRFKERYSDARQSPWKVRIEAGDNQVTLPATLTTDGWSLPRQRDRGPGSLRE
jgi:hypothetical protein